MPEQQDENLEGSDSYDWRILAGAALYDYVQERKLAKCWLCRVKWKTRGYATTLLKRVVTVCAGAVPCSEVGQLLQLLQQQPKRRVLSYVFLYSFVVRDTI